MFVVWGTDVLLDFWKLYSVVLEWLLGMGDRSRTVRSAIHLQYSYLVDMFFEKLGIKGALKLQRRYSCDRLIE